MDYLHLQVDVSRTWLMFKFNMKRMKIYKNQINGMPYRQQPYLIMHVAMNRVDPVVVHYLQMSLHAISLHKNVLNDPYIYEASLH